MNKENVKTAILEYCKNNKENIVLVKTAKQEYKTIFDKNGKTKTDILQVEIFNYLFNVVRFVKNLQNITINNIDIGDFKLKELHHETYV